MRGQVLNGIKWDLIGKGLNQVVGFFITILLSRLILPEEFALLAMVTAFSSFVNGFVNFGFSTAIIQRKHEITGELSSVFFTNIILGIVITALFYFSAKPIALFYNQPALESITRWLSCTFFISSFGLIPWALMAKRLHFKSRMKVSVIAAGVSGVVGIVCALNGLGVWSLVYQTIVNELIRSLLSYFFSRFKPVLVLDWNHLKMLSKVGLPVMMSGLIGSVFLRLDYMLVGKFFSASTLGLLFRAKSFRELVVRYSSESVGRVLFPAFSEKQYDTTWISNVANKSISLSVIMVSTLTAFLIISDSELFHILFGTNWLEAVPYFRILLLSSVTYPIVSVCTNILISLGKAKRNLAIDLVEKSGLIVGLILSVMTKNIFVYLVVDLIARIAVTTIYMWQVQAVVSLNIRCLLQRIIPYCLALGVFVAAIKLAFLACSLNLLVIMGMKYTALILLIFLYWRVQIYYNPNSIIIEIQSLIDGMLVNKKIEGKHV